MSDTTRVRPASSIVLHTLRGHVRARPRLVFDALHARFDPGAGRESRYFADPIAFFIVATGAWWYRGEYRVVPDECGSHVEHVMLNSARTARSFGRLAARRAVSDAPAAFDTLLRQLRLELE